jgi:hypothetical protein
MGLRESINNHRGLGVAAAVGLIAIAAVAIIWPSISDSASRGGHKAFYTVDDGATWFVDDANQIAPFDHKGKQAVACYLYKCGESGQPWVSHLMRYTPEGKRQREQQRADRNVDMIGSQSAIKGDMEVKEAKGGQEWVSITDPRAAAIQELKCPDGSKENMIPLNPNE